MDEETEVQTDKVLEKNTLAYSSCGKIASGLGQGESLEKRERVDCSMK